MNKTLSWTIVLVLLVGIGYAAYKYSVKNPVPNEQGIETPGTTTNPIVMDYFCANGTIIASYEKDSVALSLSDRRNFVLPQVVSGSGTRYEKDAISFLTKGNNAFLQENEVTTYDKCVAGTQTTSGSTTIFTDANKLFQFAYPNAFTLSGDLGYTTDWRLDTQDMGLLLAQATVGRGYQPQTNFSEAKFTVGTSSDPHAISTCLTDINGKSMSTPKSVVIGGNTYKKLTTNDAGAGNFYETTSYRTIRNNQCYALEYTIHSTNIGNYSPDQNIQEYNKIKVMADMESIAQSFLFLDPIVN